MTRFTKSASTKSYIAENMALGVESLSTILGKYDEYLRELVFDEKPMTKLQFIARKNPQLLSKRDAWPAPKELSDDEVLYTETNLKSAFFELGTDDDNAKCDLSILDEFADELAEKIQFPRDTAYLIALGCVASAMTRQFYYRLNARDELTKAPVCLYVVAAQPPGSAKSGIYKNLTDPIQKAYDSLNKSQAIKRAKIKAKMDDLKAQLKKETNDSARMTMIEDLAELELEMQQTPVYVYAVDDATPEGMRNMAVSQNGMINMVSEESDLVNIVLGTVYGDGRRKTNNSMFLKAWDGETISVARAGSDPVSVRVKSTMCVLAQDEAIRSILQAGQGGRGINERVLVMRERDMLNEIDFRKRRSSSVNDSLRARYANFVTALVNSDERIFTLSEAGNEALIRYMEHMQMKQRIERNRGGKSFYNDPSIQGVISKAEKQVCKIASVLHAAMSFDNGHVTSNQIDANCVCRAIGIFDQLVHNYISTAESQGYVGDKPRIDRVMQYLDSVSTRKQFVTINAIRASVKSHESFTRVESISSKLRNDILPILEQMNKVVVAGDKVYLNPREFG